MVILECHSCCYIVDKFSNFDAFQMVVVLSQVSNPCSTKSCEHDEKVRFARPTKQEEGW